MSIDLPGSVYVEADIDALHTQLADQLFAIATYAVEDRDVFHLALSGGSTPEPFYVRLVTDTRLRLFPWEKTHVWLVDERNVPLEDEKSNYLMIRESLLDHVPTPASQVHPMPVQTDDPAAEYEKTMREVFGTSDTPRLDFVLLGMGDDGHTASLFPHSDALNVQDRWVANNDGEHVTPPARITLTYPMLNAARDLAVLVVGQKKTPMLKRIAAQLATTGPDIENLPITGIKPATGRLAWYLDEAATGGDRQPSGH